MACWTSPQGVPLTEKEGAVGSDFKLDSRRTANRSNQFFALHFSLVYKLCLGWSRIWPAEWPLTIPSLSFPPVVSEDTCSKNGNFHYWQGHVWLLTPLGT